jgi:hypothetical protein
MSDQATMPVTFRLPAELVRNIDDTALAENKAPDQVVTEALRTGLPASKKLVEERYQETLRRLKDLSDDVLHKVHERRLSDNDQDRLSNLLTANRERVLEPQELDELNTLQDRAVNIAAENVIAWTLLRDRKRFSRPSQ